MKIVKNFTSSIAICANFCLVASKTIQLIIYCIFAYRIAFLCNICKITFLFFILVQFILCNMQKIGKNNVQNNSIYAKQYASLHNYLLIFCLEFIDSA